MLVHGILYSGERSPIPFSLGDITTLLPCDESEFSLGIFPRERAALPGSSAAVTNPALVSSSSRSLFGTLIQAYSLWGRVARSTCLSERKQDQAATDPWNSQSRYSELSAALRNWEAGLSAGHRWSKWYLRVYKSESLDLVLIFLGPEFRKLTGPQAYTSIFLTLGLSNIILRRTYLEEYVIHTTDVGI